MFTEVVIAGLLDASGVVSQSIGFFLLLRAVLVSWSSACPHAQGSSRIQGHFNIIQGTLGRGEGGNRREEAGSPVLLGRRGKMD